VDYNAAERKGAMLSRRAMSRAVLAVVLASLATALPVLAEDGRVVTFTSGTGSSGGSITVTNAATGSTTTTGLGQNLPPAACANILSLAAPKVGLRTELSGTSVRIFARGAIVKVVGATIANSDLATPKEAVGPRGQ
jgi:hypothetical protein